MSRCFVIQPFDERFTKRYHDIYKPAIESCSLEAYRVDYDPSVEVPIDAIEEGIRESAIVLADITIDNPNVWYELGFAYALRRPVVMICSDERTEPRYPFDIQHRTVTRYKVQSMQDFTALKEAVSGRISAILKKSEALAAVTESSPVAAVEGLSQPELAVIAAAAGSVSLPGELTSIYSLKNDVERAGFTPVAFSLGVKRLTSKRFAEIKEVEDHSGWPYPALQLTSEAWEWIEQNESKFVLRNVPTEAPDDIPF
jgi:hypothetical protein